jgi:hypothetical protein
MVHKPTPSTTTQFTQPAQPPRIPKTTSLDDAIRYWEDGDVEKGLNIPLQDWGIVYSPSQYRSEAQKRSMIGIVHAEFVQHCGRDWDVFEQQYSGLRYEYTKLIKAVRAARMARGEAKPRRVSKVHRNC